ncbi:aromatic amino acid aminotransferase [Heyndrickxia sporothermodurans]|uniref:Aminotransferase n=2 Tax=Heyndrickxia sporothermodurans TaxID=46224 RepID=A0AB37HMD5_9BACI|nr:aminotransferase [Heyndrickxia sporothermodurans]MBL5772204.1 aminotransferase [Heyndrickxia sporothermodurans]MBL5775760.1 aminotransferase [Heyndrickxia sporothermodurans]MBL5782888.1 aminotransferase [Heyndrickxia sporothermodurans]MBL5786391.1 aminotransferase [Heyndrickxia sporothermodurans]
MNPSHFLSENVKIIKPSGIRRFFDLASQMENVISLGVGEPDFVTPWNYREASILSLEEGFTAYSPNAGLLELRQEISTYMEQRFSVQYSSKNEIIVTVGASEALDIALRATLNPGEEIIVVEPCFVSYVPIVELAGGKAVTVQALPEYDFKIQPEQIEALITEKTKGIIICSPNNPTGTVLNKQDLEGIAAVALKHNLLVFSDEIYAELSYDEPYTSIASLPEMRDQTIVMNGFSKAFAMTGWRLGFVCGPKEILQAMLKIHQYAIMCAPTMSQFAAIEALKNGHTEMKKMIRSYHSRRNYMVEELNEIGLPCHIPGGAFYVFPNITSTGLSSEEFAEKLLIEQQVAVVPGSVFGASGEGYIRCSYATNIDQLQEAITRIKNFLK